MSLRVLVSTIIPKLKEFLNRFNLPFTFQSSTDAYKSGLFNDTIKKIIKNYDEIKNVVLPTLGEERRKIL